MTGNNKVWRAPLAGLASLAMLATMGVAAGTANAANSVAHPAAKTVTVKFDKATNSTSYSAYAGETITDAIGGYANIPGYANVAGDNKVFGGWSLDGKTPVDFNTKLTGSVTLKPIELEEYYGAKLENLGVVKIDFEQGIAGVQTPFGKTASYAKDAKKGDAAESTEYAVYVAQGTKLSDNLLPKDVVDHHLYTNYSIDGVKGQLKGLEVADPNGDEAEVLTIKAGDQVDAKIATFDATSTDPNKDLTDFGYPVGAKSDGTPDSVLKVDVTDASKAAAPAWFTIPQDTDAYPNATTKTVSSWKISNTASNGDVTYVPGGTSAVYKVTFVVDGNTVSTQDVNSEGEQWAALPKDTPSKDGFTFAGWQPKDGKFKTALTSYLKNQGVDVSKAENVLVTTENDAINNIKIEENTTFNAVWYNKTTGIKVTFKDASYKGHQASVSKTVAGGAFLDESLAPAWTRDGYYLAGWKLTKVSGNQILTNDPKKIFTLGDLVTLDWQVGDKTADFELEAVWKQVSADAVEAALQYVDGSVKSNKLFTAKSWADYAAAYDKIYKEYETAKYQAPASGIDKATSTKIVTELKAAWEKLVFAHNTGADLYGDTTVHRLSKGGEHFYTADAAELKVLTSKLTT
ncbi:InlB B-repeat-containing protein, partial [Bifidobacterium sp. 82T10]